MELVPQRSDLERMSQKQNESFIEYAYRWRKAASRLKTPLTEEDLITSFLRTLKKRTRITGWPDPIGLFYSGKKGNKN